MRRSFSPSRVAPVVSSHRTSWTHGSPAGAAGRGTTDAITDPPCPSLDDPSARLHAEAVYGKRRATQPASRPSRVTAWVAAQDALLEECSPKGRIPRPRRLLPLLDRAEVGLRRRVGPHGLVQA